MSAIDQIDNKIYELATDVQRKYIDAVRKHKTYQKASEKLNVNPATIQKAVKATITKAAKQGYAPNHDLTHQTAPGNVIKRVSTNYDGDGNIRQQWVIQEAEKEKQLELMQAAAEEIAKSIKPLKANKQKPLKANKDLLNLYTLTDVHLAMLAWHKEGGDDWDIDIATKTVKATFRDMLERSPDSDECLINQGGDWQQYDSFKPVTPTNGHILDSDTRPQEMVKTSINLMKWLINEALKKHKKVNVVIQIGNHDQFSAMFLQQAMIALYANEPRVSIDDSPLPYYAFKFGKVMLGFHHGHIRGNDQLPLLFATGFSKMWGETEYRDIHKGHRHHLELKEHSGVTVIEHPTIAARDSHASHGGWFSRRCAMAITYHREFGRSGITFSDPKMLKG